MSKATKLTAVTFALLINTAPVLAEKCASKLDAKTFDAGSLISCLRELETEIESLRGGVAVPSGTVIASTLECTKLGQGWSPFQEATGRFIIGAGKESKSDFANWEAAMQDGTKIPTPLTIYDPLKKGGEETHILAKPEMPPHNHILRLESRWGDKPGGRNFGWGGDDGPGGQQLEAQTYDAGGNQPHNNMPPYVALYYCKMN